LVTKWQVIEQLYNNIISASKIPSGLANLLSEELNNSQKLKVMSMIGQDFAKKDTELSDAISTFIRHAGICCKNRNFVAHAVLKQDENIGLTLTKKSSSGNINCVNARIEGLREMGQSCLRTQIYGQLINAAFALDHNRNANVSNKDWNISLELQPKPPQPRTWGVILSKA